MRYCTGKFEVGLLGGLLESAEEAWQRAHDGSSDQQETEDGVAFNRSGGLSDERSKIRAPHQVEVQSSSA